MFVIIYRTFVELAVTILLAVMICTLLTSEFLDKALMNVVFVVSTVKALSKLAIAYISLRDVRTSRKVQ